MVAVLKTGALCIGQHSYTVRQTVYSKLNVLLMITALQNSDSHIGNKKKSYSNAAKNLWRQTENTLQPINHMVLLGSCRWRCVKVQLVSLRTLQQWKPNLIFALCTPPASHSYILCSAQTQNISIGQPEITWRSSPTLLTVPAKTNNSHQCISSHITSYSKSFTHSSSPSPVIR